MKLVLDYASKHQLRRERRGLRSFLWVVYHLGWMLAGGLISFAIYSVLEAFGFGHRLIGVTNESFLLFVICFGTIIAAALGCVSRLRFLARRLCWIPLIHGMIGGVILVVVAAIPGSGTPPLLGLMWFTLLFVASLALFTAAVVSALAA